MRRIEARDVGEQREERLGAHLLDLSGGWRSHVPRIVDRAADPGGALPQPESGTARIASWNLCTLV
jgi:hypothetical protein